jgi:methyltransferase (TIGR00027 family)
MTRKATETGPGAMGLVAMEQIKFPESRRILKDDLAYWILPFGMRAAIRLKAGPFSGDFIVRQVERKVPGLWGSIMCRKRYFDDEVSEAVEGGQVGAVVNLGAGFDTRACRLPALTGIQVFELDQPCSIDQKRSRLKKLFGQIPDQLTLVPIDFDREKLGEALESGGWKSGTKTFFIWEGVTQYLTESGVRSTFDFLARAAAGSRLAFTYIRKDFLDGKALDGYEFLYKRMVLKDRVWLFGLDPADVENLLGRYGWRVLEHLGYNELARRYVKPTGRNLLSMPMERIIYAEKAGTSNR